MCSRIKPTKRITEKRKPGRPKGSKNVVLKTGSVKVENKPIAMFSDIELKVLKKLLSRLA